MIWRICERLFDWCFLSTDEEQQEVNPQMKRTRPNHIHDRMRVVYRAGVCKDAVHPHEGKIGTAYHPSEWFVQHRNYEHALTTVYFDGEIEPKYLNCANLIGLDEWMYENEIAKNARKGADLAVRISQPKADEPSQHQHEGE